MKKVLFVCTGNTCRSPMAMAVFNDIAEKTKLNWVADSAGLAAFGDPINPKAEKALEKQGIKDFCYISKPLNIQHIEESSFLIVMTQSHKEVLLSVGASPEKIIVLGDGISDPYGGDEEEYENCLKQILSGIEQLIDRGIFDD